MAMFDYEFDGTFNDEHGQLITDIHYEKWATAMMGGDYQIGMSV